MTMIDHNDHKQNGIYYFIDEEMRLYQILLTFESEEYEKSYVLVHPISTEEQEEEVEIFAFSYTESDGGLEGQLDDIETEEEWDMIEEVLGAFVEEEEE